MFHIQQSANIFGQRFCNIVRESKRVSTLPVFKKLRERFFDQAMVVKNPDGKFFNAAWSMGGAEAFLLNIPFERVRSRLRPWSSAGERLS